MEYKSQENTYKPKEDDYEEIIGKGNVDRLVTCAQKIGEEIARKKVTTSQIRGIYATAQQIQVIWPVNEAGEKAGELSIKEKHAYRQAMLLRPRIGYAGAVDNRNRLHGLDEVLIEALKRIDGGGPSDRRQRYSRFMDFFEAIVAYHKINGGS